MATNTVFSERIRQAITAKRKRTGIRFTVSDLAIHAQVERNTADGWMNRGAVPKNPATLARIARALDVSIEWLLGESDEGRPRSGAVMENFNVTPRVALGIPQPVREFIQEELLAYTRAGVSEEELEHARNLFTSPEALAFYKGGVQGEYDEKKFLGDMRGYAKFLRETFKRRGYKPL